jgi:tRNA(Ile)-lysidine synthase
MNSKQSSISHKLQNSVLSSIKEAGLLNSKITVSVSGGPDSLTLLHVLNKFANEGKIQIIGAHLNHNIRGQEALSDEKHVIGIFKNLKIPYEISNCDVPELSRVQNISIEEAARKSRHAFMHSTNLKHETVAAAMGHTLDDQAESILMHIMRGSGINGLKGMNLISKRVIDNMPVTIFRPLLNFLKSDIEKYCKENDIFPVIDSTNLSDKYKRNFVRLNILPLMEKYNPAIKNSLIRLSQTSSNDLDFINQECELFWSSKVKSSLKYLSIPISELLDAPEAISSRILIKSILHLQNKHIDISLSMVKSLMSLINGKTGRQLKMANLVAVKQYNELIIYKKLTDIIPLPTVTIPIKIATPGITRISGWEIQVSYGIVPENHSSLGILGGIAWVKKDFKDNIFIRTRINGDFFYPSKFQGKKKLKNFMIDSKIPQLWRDKIPLILINEKIAWVVGWRIAEWAYPNPKENGIKIEFTRQNDEI